MNHGGIFNQVLGGWELTETQTFQCGKPVTVTFSGSPYQYLPGASRPNILTTNSQSTVQHWDIGPNRLPTSAQNPYLNFSSFGYPAPFRTGSPGTFARITGVQGSFSGAGAGCPYIWTIGRFEF